MTHTIYALTEPNGEIRYIGQTARSLRKRLNVHIATRTDGTHRGRWISKLLREGNRPQMAMLAEVGEEHWAIAESCFIRLFAAAGYRLTNKHPGGTAPPSRKGLKCSDQHKANLRKALTGRKLSEDHKEAIRRTAPHITGKKLSPEARSKISAKNLVAQKLRRERERAETLEMVAVRRAELAS